MTPRSRRGLSLVEVLIVCAILGVMGSVLTYIYSVALTTYRQGGGRVDIQQRARESIRRIAPLISTAIPPNSVQEAIYSPALGASDVQMSFCTPLDLLANETVASTNPRAPRYLLFRIRFDAPSSTVVLEDPANPARSQVLARKVRALTFQRVAVDSVKIHVEVETRIIGARFKERTVDAALDTLQQVPWYTSK